MSVLLTKVLYYGLNDKEGSTYTNPTNITDVINFDSARGLDIKNNVLSINLKNSRQSLDDNGNIIHRYIDPSTFETIFQENDQIVVYARYTDDMSVVEDSSWGNNNNLPSSDYLVGTFFLTDYNLKQTPKGQEIEILCVDKTAVLFNQLLAKTFNLESTSGTSTGTTANKLVDSGAEFTNTVNPGMRVTNTTDDTVTFVTGVDNDTTISLNDDIFVSGESYKIEWTAPSILQKVIRFVSEKQDGIKEGSGTDSGVSYDVDAKTESEGGFIQDIRRSVTEQGTVNSDRAFPAISLSKVWKPVYEWVEELSQIESINDTQELDGTDDIVYGQSFIYYIDENNIFHWIERSNTVDTNIDIDTAEDVYSLSLKKTVFDSVNFIVYRGGEDLYGVGTLGYQIDTTAGSKNLKMRVIAMTDIANTWIEKEIAQNNLVEDNSTPGEFTFSGNRYSPASFGFITSWGVDTSGFTNDDYNDSLRAKIEEESGRRAKTLISRLSGQRYKGSMETKGQIITPGTLFEITDTDTGIISEKIRVTQAQHNFTKEGWFTTLTLEQDEDAITGEA